MRTVVALLTTLILACTLHGKESPKTLLERVPTTLAGLERDAIKGYDKPELGASASYKKQGLLVTVYLYDLGVEDIGDGVSDATVRKAFQLAVSDITEAVKQGYYSDVEEVDEGSANFGKNRRTLRSRFRLTRLKGSDTGERFVSEIHAWGGLGHIVKLRVTGTVEEEAGHSKTLEQFVPALMDALRKMEKRK
jgi:hypothetical protein